MPSSSAKQAKLMSAIAHGWHPKHPSKKLPPLSVAREFHEADKRVGKFMHADGGPVNDKLTDEDNWMLSALGLGPLAFSPDAHRLMNAGVAGAQSQLLGRGAKPGMPGMAYSAMSLPVLLEALTRGHIPAPGWAHRAAQTAGDISNDVHQNLGVPQPRGFGEHLMDAAGTMSTQIPMGGEGLGLTRLLAQYAPKTVGALRSTLGPVAEWLGPTIHPKPINYAIGTAAGTGLGEAGDLLAPPEPQGHADGGKISGLEALLEAIPNTLKSRAIHPAEPLTSTDARAENFRRYLQEPILPRLYDQTLRAKTYGHENEWVPGAVNDWMATGHYKLNEALRSQQGFDPTLAPESENIKSALDKLMQRYKIQNQLALYRGIHGGIDPEEAMHDPGYQSWTVNPRIAYDFANSGDKPGLIMARSFEPGELGVPLKSAQPRSWIHEMEVLTPPTQFRALQDLSPMRVKSKYTGEYFPDAQVMQVQPYAEGGKVAGLAKLAEELVDPGRRQAIGGILGTLGAAAAAPLIKGKAALEHLHPIEEKPTMTEKVIPGLHGTSKLANDAINISSDLTSNHMPEGYEDSFESPIEHHAGTLEDQWHEFKQGDYRMNWSDADKQDYIKRWMPGRNIDHFEFHRLPSNLGEGDASSLFVYHSPQGWHYSLEDGPEHVGPFEHRQDAAAHAFLERHNDAVGNDLEDHGEDSGDLGERLFRTQHSLLRDAPED